VTQQNRDLIERIAQAICSGSLDEHRSDFTEHPHWYVGGDHLLSGDHDGFDEICRFASALNSACRGTYACEYQKSVADSDHGYALLRSRGERSGQELKSWFVLAFRIVKDKVDAIWTFPYDQAVETRMFARTSDSSRLIAKLQ
jgi:hypothetical protein